MDVTGGLTKDGDSKVTIVGFIERDGRLVWELRAAVVDGSIRYGKGDLIPYPLEQMKRGQGPAVTVNGS